MAKLFSGGVINQTVTVYQGSTVFVSAPIIGTGEPQLVNHGLPFTPAKVMVAPIGLPGGSAWSYSVGEVTANTIPVTATAGVSYVVIAWTRSTVPAEGPIRLTAPDDSVWEVDANEYGVLSTVRAVGQGGAGSITVEGADGSRWALTVDSEGVLTTTRIGNDLYAARLAEYTPDTIPAPTFATHRSFISVVQDNADEELRYCRRKADGTYEWIIVAF